MPELFVFIQQTCIALHLDISCDGRGALDTEFFQVKEKIQMITFSSVTLKTMPDLTLYENY